MTKLSSAEYRLYREGYWGYCIACEDWTADCGIEPDARDYECPACSDASVYGAEEALMMGFVEIGELE